MGVLRWGRRKETRWGDRIAVMQPGSVGMGGYTRHMASRVLLLDNTVHSRLFPLGERWAARLTSAARVDRVNASSAPRLPDVRDYTHLVLTGSEASVLKPPQWVRREAELVRTAAGSGVPILGSCFGHELLVWALSGPGYVARAARPEFGWTSVRIVERDSLLCGIPSPWTVFAFHVAEVVSPPPPWRVLASSRKCATHVLRYGEKPIWGVQAHPEITRRSSEFALRAHLLVTQRRGGLPRTTWRRAPADLQAVSALVANFLDVGRAA
ncbi:MAG: type 1 glutamine amidotransferase [Candidatus Bipolaricaulis sp.]|nr:type 1 glutamine amidotransferase [Candidatus Bipolaricaulis sp.]